MAVSDEFVEELRQQLGDEVVYPEDAASLLQDPIDVDFLVIGAGASGAVVAARLATLFPR